jgi:very-short-patch-repair endonuclease
VLAHYMRWVVEFRGVCVRHGLSARALEAASRPAPDVSAVGALRGAAGQAEATLAALRQAVGWPADYLAGAPLAEIAGRATALRDAAAQGPRWAAYVAARRPVEQGIAQSLLPAAAAGTLAMGDLAPAFLRAFWLKWLADVVTARPALERFATATHEERIAEFRRLDERVFLENRAALVGQLRERTQHRLRAADAAPAMAVLRRELARQRGHAPLRKTLTAADAAVRAIKPCWMMSPLTVAQYVAAQAAGGANAGPPFDLVIFDEASQLPVEDAVGAVMRGAQLVVVGDPKQLPPTNFFSASIGQADVPRGEDGAPLYEDSESVLEEFMGSGMPMSRLKWHYRSAHESLITFSNVSFYDGDLYTFPSVETGSDAAGLRFDFVDGGVYEGKGLNLVEARRVADEVVAFARAELARRAGGAPARSLGVGTFSLRQQLAIQDELERRRRDDPSVEPFFDRAGPEPFFVKNLENIQGDERDVVFLSVTYARGPDGRLRHHFGPLNGENGWRRLNVLTTRARQRMVVFASMRGDDIDAGAETARGARLLREFLRYAERGRLEGAPAGAGAGGESPFERDVREALERHGVRVAARVGVGGYRVDLGVLDDAAPGRFVCGIECDGADYRRAETARDRDRLRQQVLEARGWTLHRVWSTDWFKDRPGQVERLLRLVAEARAGAAAREDARRAAEAEARAAAAPARGDGPDDSHDDLPNTGPPVGAAGPAAGVAGAPAAPPGGGRGAPAAYVRPVAPPYDVAADDGRHAGADLLAAPAGRLLDAVRLVIDAEAPVHEAELVGRVAGMWGARAGSRVQARILDAVRAAEAAGAVRRRGDFLWAPSDAVRARSRARHRTPAERIAPEEYAAAVRLVLGAGHAFPRGQLTTEVRAVLGFARTGAALDEAIGAVVDALLASGELGEGSGGLRLRVPAPGDAAGRPAS